ELGTYRAIYKLTKCKWAGPVERRGLRAREIGARGSEEDQAYIRATGPLGVASNHPHGVLESLVVAAILRSHRMDARILTRDLLGRIPELADLCFFVDPFARSASSARSQAGLRAARLWLRDGGALVVFPSGEVAHQAGPLETRVDSPWRPTVG